jgi:hypothetical protein
LKTSIRKIQTFIVDNGVNVLHLSYEKPYMGSELYIVFKDPSTLSSVDCDIGTSKGYLE